MQNMMNAGDFHSAEPWLYEECLRENIRARVEAYYNNEESRMTEDMKKNRLFTTICLMAAILFTACTQDELAEQGNTLPDGEYPLQIGSVSITAEASEEPWTRVGENEDGSGNDYEGIGGAGDGEVGTLTIQDATVHTYGGQQFHHPHPSWRRQCRLHRVDRLHFGHRWRHKLHTGRRGWQHHQQHRLLLHGRYAGQDGDV